jgi:hypothetical protein
MGFLLMMLTKTGPLTLSCLTVCIRKRREEKRSGQSHIIFGGFTHSFYVDTYQLGGSKLQKSQNKRCLFFPIVLYTILIESFNLNRRTVGSSPILDASNYQWSVPIHRSGFVES